MGFVPGVLCLVFCLFCFVFSTEWSLEGHQRLTSSAKENVSLLEVGTDLLKLEAGMSIQVFQPSGWFLYL